MTEENGIKIVKLSIRPDGNFDQEELRDLGREGGRITRVSLPDSPTVGHAFVVMENILPEERKSTEADELPERPFSFHP